jgi:hypothetical protein
MNDLEIRKNFHTKKLQKYHANNNTLVIDELGLNHGKNRADIAVISCHLVGYEIKSNSDSLIRLKDQIRSYNSIFSKAYIIVGNRYQDIIHKHIPNWWGIIVSARGNRNTINFHLVRKAYKNKQIQPISIARLLWRNEVVEILAKENISPKLLRQPRATLYEYLTSIFEISELEKMVIKYLKQRKNWRYPLSTLLCDD